MSNSNKSSKYQKIIENLKEKLAEVSLLYSMKKKFEKENVKDDEF